MSRLSPDPRAPSPAAMAAGPVLYFAYGSNMHPGRMLERVPSARAIGAARLPGFRLEFHKRGRDGSGKCDIVPASGDVWGALYAMAAAEVGLLDAVEGDGYERVTVTTRLMTGDSVREAFAYRARASHIAASLLPRPEYLAFVCDGARHHGLPGEYRAWLDSIVSQARCREG